MKRFIIKNIVFFSPFILWISLVVLVDPYIYFPKVDYVDKNIKIDISYKLNRPLFQLINFKNNPTHSILLGDSRANRLNVCIIKKLVNKDFSNLAYGGGSMQEIIETFWETAKDRNLQEVYIGINFSLYNKYNIGNRVVEAIEISNNFILYAFYTSTFKAIFYISKSFFLNSTVNIELPTSSKNQFWDYQLNVITNKRYCQYAYPDNYFKDLELISKYCQRENIRLVFFIPPTHVDLQNKVLEFNLQHQEERFKNDLQKLGDLYDFDFPSLLTKNKNNFKDPYHFSDSVGIIVVKELFIQASDNCRKYIKK
jgi:hypothetical protein